MKKKVESLAISKLNKQIIQLELQGTAPYVQARFWKKAQLQLQMEAGQTTRSKRKRDARDFDSDMEQSIHFSSDGWIGIPASSFRSACISACRLVGFKMTIAKLSIFIQPDGFDKNDGVPLVKLIAKKPEQNISPVRNATGVIDLRSRPMWREWGAKINISFDGDQFTASDIVNLINRAGQQVGIGEGRPDSKNSHGMGWGTFKIKGEK